MSSCDVVVIGAGPGGYTAAIRCAQLGAKVAVVEKGDIGGTCLNRGCIPTKTLLAATDILRGMKNADKFGIRNVKYDVDFTQMMANKNRVVAQLKGGIGTLFKSNGIEVLKGTAKFISPKQLEVTASDGQATPVAFGKAIIATGSVPLQVPDIPFDGTRVIFSDEALALATVPATLLIVGGGVIGVELASIFSALGAKVTIIEKLPRILATEDEEIAGLLHKSLAADGVVIKTNENVRGVPAGYEKIIVAVGRKAVTEGLGLDTLGIAVEKGKIVVNKKMETAVSGIYAVGDVTGGMMLAYKASQDGLIAAENAVSNKNLEVNCDIIPTCIYTNPEVSSVGLTERQAIEQGLKVKVGKFPFAANGKAVALGETKGMVKMVIDDGSGKILGAQIIGPKATELISQVAILLKMEATTEDLKRILFPHPTLSETLYCAAEAAEGKAIDLPKR